MVATYKLNIPAPATKDSRAFAQALKVCIAASTYGVKVDFAKASAEQVVTLDVPTEHVTLYEANAIVRFFANVGTSKHQKEAESLPDEALIEWEETILQNMFSSQEETKGALQEIENILATAPFTKSTSLPPSPAEIILFSTLYSPISTTSSIDLGNHPLLKTWFFELALISPWALSGIEQAAAQTSESQKAPQHGK